MPPSARFRLFAAPLGLEVAPASEALSAGTMDQNKTTLERAFELAGSGMPVDLIRAKLNAEGYDGRQLQGRALNNQLLQLSKRRGRMPDRT